MTLAIISVAIALVVIVVLVFRRKTGYRGAIGFKNRYRFEIAAIQLTGLAAPLDCRTLAPGEHSFNYVGRQSLPADVRIAWRFVGDAVDKTATVSLSTVPRDATDGELFFVLSSGGSWSVEYASQLQLDTLQKSE
jgi:hypothetical protein